MPALTQHLFMPEESDWPLLQEIDRALERQATNCVAKLIIYQGEKIELPEGAIVLPPFLVQVLKQIAHEAALGNSIRIVFFPMKLTILQAAEFLDAPVSHVRSLLESGKLSSLQEGTDQYILLDDLKYKKFEYEDMLEGLDEIMAISQEAGLYD